MWIRNKKMNRIEKLSALSIHFLQSLKNTETFYLAHSGGKDSIVIYHLAKLADLQFYAYHTNTTIDPKGTLKFIRDNYPDVEILHPTESFYQLVKRKGLPTRLARFCCEYLKEYASIGKNVIEGVRASESKNRKGRDYIHCDTRKIQKGAKHIYPIYDWTDNDVWNYIKIHNLPVAPAYSKGFNRLGCVGCPLVTRKGVRVREFMLEPKKLMMIRKAIRIGMKNNPQWKISLLTGGDEEKAIEWWISGKTMDEYNFSPKLFNIPTCV